MSTGRVRFRPLATIAGGVIVAGFALVIWYTAGGLGARATAHQRDELVMRVAELEAQLARVKRVQRDVRLADGMHARSAGKESEEKDSRAPVDAAPDEPREEIVDALAAADAYNLDLGARTVRHLDGELTLEARDVGWERAVADRARELVAELPSGAQPATRLVATNCGSVLCKLRVEGAAAAEGLVISKLSALGGSTFAHPDEAPRAGEFRWTIFITRAGHDMPRLLESAEL